MSIEFKCRSCGSKDLIVKIQVFRDDTNNLYIKCKECRHQYYEKRKLLTPEVLLSFPTVNSRYRERITNPLKRENCERCKRSFVVTGSRYNALKYCSKKCFKKQPKPPSIKKIQIPKPIRAKPLKPRVGFYMSKEWLDLRYRVLKKHSRQCMVCFRTGVEIHVDHIKPISKFPDLALVFENLQVLCRDCNMGKSNKDSIDWRPQ